MNLVSKVDEQLIRTVANAIFDAAGLETVSSINRDDFIELTSNFIFDMDVLPKWKRINRFKYKLVAYGAMLALVVYEFGKWHIDYHDHTWSSLCYPTLNEARHVAETRIFQQS